VVVAVGQGGDILPVSLADGFIVVEVVVSVDENVVDPGAEQAGDSKVEELGEFVGEEGQESIDEEQKYQKPFENGVDHEVRELPQLLLHETTEGSLRHFSFVSL
ncbi:hypothetical protein TorRG33x02_181610, partial [Trema orientale]